MRKILPFLLLAFQITVFGQITITESDLPMLGTTVIVKNAALPTIPLGQSSSEAQVWDYSTLEGINSKVVEFIDPISTIDPKTYPNADMARLGPLGDMFGFSLEDLLPVGGIGLPDATGYFSHQEDGTVTLEGVNIPLDISGILELGPTNLIASEPFPIYNAGTYGSVINGTTEIGFTAYVEQLGGDAQLTIAMDKVSTADAFGTLNLPDYEDLEVVRFKEVNDVELSLATLVAGFPIPLFDTLIQINTYKYYSKEKGYPVATLTMLPPDSIGNSAIARIEYLTVAEAPQALFTIISGTECGTYTFLNQSSGIGLTYDWSINDGSFSTIATPVYTFTENGDYTITLLVTDAYGVQSQATANLTVDCQTGTGVQSLPYWEYFYDREQAVILIGNSMSVKDANLYDIMGRKIPISTDIVQNEIILPEISSGIYILELVHNNSRYSKEVFLY